MDTETKQRLRLQNDLICYASNILKIRTKAGSVDPFVFNKAQLYIHQRLEYQKGQTGKVRALILKGRQQGCSTMVAARYYHKVTHNKGIQAFILTHDLEATNNLYKIAKRYYENSPPQLTPAITASNAKELKFGVLDSGYKIGTAKNKAVGRSSTIQLLHGSEVGFWDNAPEHAAGIMQAVPNEPNTEIILESTANGQGNYFHQEWQKAEAGISDYIAIFVPWYWQDEYQRAVPPDFDITFDEEQLKEDYGLTDEQLVWRRHKIIELSVNGVDGSKLFKQEYPCNAQEAFQLTGEDTYINPEHVVRARKADELEKYGALVIGVDPARYGDDRTSIIFRQGRVAYDLISYHKKSTMEVSGIVHMLIEKHNPVKVFVDVGGLGAGVVDRLIELGHRNTIVAVNAGASPLDGAKYKNKRAEMWGEMNLWLQEPCKIPDSDTLHADLCSVRYSFDSNSRLVLEKKEDLKRRGIRSPDEADALALTFAYPAAALQKEANPHNSVSESLRATLNARSQLLRTYE